MTTRTIEPTQITTGGTVEWTRVFNDYPADEWTLQYRFRGPGEGFNIDAEQNADDPEKFDVTIDPANTEDVDTAGRYTWEAWVTNIADPTIIKLAVSPGRVMIAIGFDADETATVETRSIARRIVDSIDAAFEAWISSDVISYEISTPSGTRKVTRSDKVMMEKMRDKYAKIVANEIARERVRNGGSVLQSVGIRFIDV